MAQSTSSAAARGAIYFILVQIGSRALTFALNQALLRYLSPEILGISVQLELYSISVLFFARESLRVALQRQTVSGATGSENGTEDKWHGAFLTAHSPAGKTQTVVNLAYISFALGIPLTVILGTAYLRSSNIAVSIPYFSLALRLYGLAALVELLSEPGFVVAQQKMLYGTRASAESFATISKCLVTCASTIWAAKTGRQWGVLPFALGQLAYACALLVVYMVRLWPVCIKERFSLLPQRLTSLDSTAYIFSLFSRPLCALGVNLYFQSTLKYVLTQGDALLIATLASLPDQGAYALASNYGGLIARMVFQPIEETSRNLFAKLCTPETAHAQPPAAVSESTAPSERAQRAKSDTAQQPELSSDPSRSKTSDLDRAAQILHLLLRAYALLSLPLLLFVPPLSRPLLHLLAGPRWSDPSSPAPSTLAKYGLYIPILALNGITEAFVSATATAAQLRLQSAWMALFFALFAGSAWVFVRGIGAGAAGLVYANCVNLGARILWSLWFIRGYFGERRVDVELRSCLPRAGSVAAAVGTWAVLNSGTVVKGGGGGAIEQILRIGVVGVGFVVVLLITERKFLMHSYNLLR